MFLSLSPQCKQTLTRTRNFISIVLSHFGKICILIITGEMRYAETWDFDVTPATFLQFDIAMGCSGTYSTLYRYLFVFYSKILIAVRK